MIIIKKVLNTFFFPMFLLIAESTMLAKDLDDQLWRNVLTRYLKQGEFNYSELKNNKAQSHELQEYIKKLESLSKKDYEKLSRNQKMAFLINAYNALTVKLIIENYPVQSIKDIGGIFTKPWSIKFFNLLDGSIRSIDPIEHDYLRPNFQDYRIHAAVNCASKSCPVLRNEPFSADRLDQQLDEQMTQWLSDESRNRVDTSSKTIFLSKIFDWYEKDFETWGGGISKVLIKHCPQIFQSALEKGFRIKYLDYDWSLNEPKRHK